MKISLGKKGLHKSHQLPFQAVVDCSCGDKARIAFVAHEAIEKDDTESYVCRIHPNTGKGGYWPHDAISVAVYFCKTCFSPVVRWNQA